MNEALTTDHTKVVVSLNRPTPIWATWIFRTVFLITTALTIWVAGTAKIKQDDKIEYMLIMKAADVVVWGIGRFLGVKKVDFEPEP